MAPYDSFDRSPSSRAIDTPLSLPHDTVPTEAPTIAIDEVPLYQYTPLKKGEIRLLVIEPHHRELEYNATIKCRLDHIYLGGHRKYQTISHACGTTSPDGSHLTHEIVCGGLILKVTEPIHTLLNNLRKRLQPLQNVNAWFDLSWHGAPIWLNSVCINQADDLERAAQMAIMGEIYKNSCRLLIWLGNELEDTTLRDVVEGRFLENELIFNENAAQELSTFFQARWFSRRWALQEVLLTQPDDRWIIVNQLVFHVSMLGIALQPLGLHGSHSELGFPFNVYQSMPWLLNMERYRATQCSDPRDLVFSMINICEHGGMIKPDYTVRWQEIFKTFAARHIRKESLIHLMVSAALRHSSSDTEIELPSWVPNWQRNIRVDRGFDMMYSEEAYRNEGRCCAFKFRLEPGGVLCLEGRVLPLLPWDTLAGDQRDRMMKIYEASTSYCEKTYEMDGCCYLFLPGCSFVFVIRPFRVNSDGSPVYELCDVFPGVKSGVPPSPYVHIDRLPQSELLSLADLPLRMVSLA